MNTPKIKAEHSRVRKRPAVWLTAHSEGTMFLLSLTLSTISTFIMCMSPFFLWEQQFITASKLNASSVFGHDTLVLNTHWMCSHCQTWFAYQGKTTSAIFTSNYEITNWAESVWKQWGESEWKWVNMKDLVLIGQFTLIGNHTNALDQMAWHFKW